MEGDITQKLLDLARWQVEKQVDTGDDVDTKATGVLGFLGILAALFLTGREHLTWLNALSFIALLLTVVAALFSMRNRLFQVGPRPAAFYDRHRSLPEPDLDRQLLSDLSQALSRNGETLARKSWWLEFAMWSLVAFVLLAVVSHFS